MYFFGVVLGVSRPTPLNGGGVLLSNCLVDNIVSYVEVCWLLRCYVWKLVLHWSVWHGNSMVKGR